MLHHGPVVNMCWVSSRAVAAAVDPEALGKLKFGSNDHGRILQKRQEELTRKNEELAGMHGVLDGKMRNGELQELFLQTGLRLDSELGDLSSAARAFSTIFPPDMSAAASHRHSSRGNFHRKKNVCDSLMLEDASPLLRNFAAPDSLSADALNTLAAQLHLYGVIAVDNYYGKDTAGEIRDSITTLHEIGALKKAPEFIRDLSFHRGVDSPHGEINDLTERMALHLESVMTAKNGHSHAASLDKKIMAHRGISSETHRIQEHKLDLHDLKEELIRRLPGRFQLEAVTHTVIWKLHHQEEWKDDQKTPGEPVSTPQSTKSQFSPHDSTGDGNLIVALYVPQTSHPDASKLIVHVPLNVSKQGYHAAMGIPKTCVDDRGRVAVRIELVRDRLVLFRTRLVSMEFLPPGNASEVRNVFNILQEENTPTHANSSRLLHGKNVSLLLNYIL